MATSNTVWLYKENSQTENILAKRDFSLTLKISYSSYSSRPPSLFLWGRRCASAGGKKHCNAFCSCPNAHQLADAHVRGAMETKMAAGWEYDELASQKLHHHHHHQVSIMSLLGLGSFGILFLNLRHAGSTGCVTIKVARIDCFIVYSKLIYISIYTMYKF
jgi:hypothetical protein